MKIQPMWTPSEEWGPALVENRTQSYFKQQDRDEPNGNIPQHHTPQETDDIVDTQFSYNTLDTNAVTNEDSYI